MSPAIAQAAGRGCRMAGRRRRRRGTASFLLALLALTAAVAVSRAQEACRSVPLPMTFEVDDYRRSTERTPARAPSVQPPIRSSSMRRRSIRDLKGSYKFDRSSSLADETEFSFVHISKCSGASFIQWARGKHNVRSNGTRTFPVFFPPYAQGVEMGNLYDAAHRAHYTRLSMLRSPRSHVMSLFKECRFDTWGLDVIKQRTRDGLRTVPHEGTHKDDFVAWVDYFVAANDTSGLGCYNPWNYQSRALLSFVREPHAVGCTHDYEPSFDGALSEALQLDWVGLQDFYHESLCLLMFRIEGNAHPYMSSCACDAVGQNRVSAAQWVDVHEDHNDGGQRISSHLDLDVATTAKLDRLTVVDRSVFGVVLRGFLAEVVQLEARLGRRVMCDATLESTRESLAYIADVPTLYKLLKIGAMPP